MLALASALKMYGRELDKPMQDVYWHTLQDLTDEEFERAAQVLIRRETDFPPPAMFLQLARPPVDLKAEAHRVMCRAWFAGKTYDPEGGTGWSAEQIRAVLGVGAYEAFHACGGAKAFQQMDDEFHGPGIRRAFMECYVSTVSNDPKKALPQAEDALAVLEPKRFLQLVGEHATRGATP